MENDEQSVGESIFKCHANDVCRSRVGVAYVGDRRRCTRGTCSTRVNAYSSLSLLPPESTPRTRSHDGSDKGVQSL